MLYVTSNSSQSLSVEVRDNFTADNGLYIMDILKLCSVIVMVTPVTAEDKFQEDGDLIYAGEFLEIAGTPNGDYTKKLRVRRLICRVCKLKFRTRQETQDHIRREHRRGEASSQHRQKYW
jgi:hypothetical protein